MPFHSPTHGKTSITQLHLHLVVERPYLYVALQIKKKKQTKGLIHAKITDKCFWEAHKIIGFYSREI